MRAILMLAAAATLFAAAAAKDLITPANEPQLDARIAVLQQNARLAACDPQERICAMGRTTLAFDGVKLGWKYPDCGGDQACDARKKARNDAATQVAVGLAPTGAPKDIYIETIRNRLPESDVVAAYIEGVQHTLAHSTCPASERVCAIGRLAYLVEIDQLARFQSAACQPIGIEKGPDARLACLIKAGPAVEAVDKICREALERITDQFGWPDAVHWGETTEHNAWLLAQHADEDQVRQKKFLALIKASFEQGVTPAVSYAYIADRQAWHLNRPQLYGTQGQCVGEGEARHWEPNPIADEAHLEARRAEAGMVPYAQYRKDTDQMCHGK